MRKTILSLIFFLVALIIPGFAQMSRSVEKYDGSNYALVYRPTTMKPKGVILFLHGIGERKAKGSIDILEKLALPKVLKEGVEIPYVVLAPQLNANGWWQDILENIFKKLDALAAEHSVTERHITGLSLGGGGTVNAVKFAYIYNGNKPGYFKSYGVVCGWMDNQVSPTTKPYYEGTKWKIWHGTADPTVAYSKGVFLYDQLTKNGIEATLVTLEGVKHDAWTHAYNIARDDDYLQWLESFEASKQEPEPVDELAAARQRIAELESDLEAIKAIVLKSK